MAFRPNAKVDASRHTGETASQFVLPGLPTAAARHLQASVAATPYLACASAQCTAAAGAVGARRGWARWTVRRGSAHSTTTFALGDLVSPRNTKVPYLKRWTPPAPVPGGVLRTNHHSFLMAGSTGPDGPLPRAAHVIAMASGGDMEAEAADEGTSSSGGGAGNAAGSTQRGPGRPGSSSGACYYAVAAGRQTGVFYTWDKARSMVDGFSGAVYRKFSSHSDAQDFVSSRATPAAAAASTAGLPGEDTWRAAGEVGEGGADGASISGEGADPGAVLGSASKEPYYAVAKGHKVGLMRSWAETRAAVEGASGPVYKRFKTKAEAEAFLFQYSALPGGAAGAKRKPGRPKREVASASPEAGAATAAAALVGGHDVSGGEAEGPAPAESEAGPPVYYAVARGRKTGVFTSWSEASAVVDGVSGAVFKKFRRLSAAEAFAAKGGAARRRAPLPAAAGPSTPLELEPSGRPAAPNAAAAGDAAGVRDDDAGAEVPPAKQHPSYEEAALTSQQLRRPPTASSGPQGAGAASFAAANAEGPAPKLKGRDAKAEERLSLLDFGSLGAAIDPSREYRLEFDGGSRRNPGDAGFGAVLVDPSSGRHVEYVAGPLTASSNNVAEWSALAAGMQVALEMGVRHLVVQGDSELVCRQVSGRYGVNNANLQSLAARVSLLQASLDSFEVAHVPRAQNAVADALSNLAMDAEAAVAEAADEGEAERREAREQLGADADDGTKDTAAERRRQRMAPTVQYLGETALLVARAAAAAAAEAPLSSSVLKSTAVDAAAAAKPARRGRQRQERAGGRTKIRVTECRPLLAARGSVAGHVSQLRRTLLALAYAGRGLLD